MLVRVVSPPHSNPLSTTGSYTVDFEAEVGKQKQMRCEGVAVSDDSVISGSGYYDVRVPMVVSLA